MQFVKNIDKKLNVKLDLEFIIRSEKIYTTCIYCLTLNIINNNRRASRKSGLIPTTIEVLE